MLALPGSTLVFAAGRCAAASGLEAAGATVEYLPTAGDGLDLAAVLRRLGALECNDVLVEAGPTLAGSLMAAGFVDEIVLYLAPHLMGDTARGLFSLPGLEKMADRVQLQITDLRRVGDDLRLRAVLAPRDR
jgi:diaminohydroxyphosphoribosylaminopyrimidine deaminase/5-amino-6-(5-phosphoribosylamino)uracil reductase